MGKGTVLADRRSVDACSGGEEDGVGLLVGMAVNALWHLLVVGGLVEFGELWWLVLVEARSFWWLVFGINKSCCEIGLGKSLRGGWYVCIVFELLKVQ